MGISSRVPLPTVFGKQTKQSTVHTHSFYGITALVRHCLAVRCEDHLLFSRRFASCAKSPRTLGADREPSISFLRTVCGVRRRAGSVANHDAIATDLGAQVL